MTETAWLRRRLRPLPALAGALAAAIVALLGMVTPGDAAAQTPLTDRWSGRWEVTFTTDGNGGERTTGSLCCMVVTLLPEEQGLALVRGTTGVIGDGTFTDVVCSGGSRLFYEALSPFEFVSGVTGVVPGPDKPTGGARAVLCTDDSDTAIRGHYKNDLGAFDPLISKPVAEGSLLATLQSAPQTFEGSLTRFPGDFPGPTYSTRWEGHCIEGACRQVLRRPRMKITRLSTYNALLGFLRGARGARLELSRPDGTARPLKVGESIDLGDGDVVTSHGMYADVTVTRADATTVTIAIEPGGSIAGIANPDLIRHRGGKIVAGSAAGFTADSSVWTDSNSLEHARPSATIRTTMAKGRVTLELDPAGRSLTVRSLAGRARVQAGAAALTLAPGQDARAGAGTILRLPPAPDLSRAIAAPRVLTAGPVRLLAPGRIATRSLAGARCLRTRLQSTAPAQVLVTLLVGTARKGNAVVQRRVRVGTGAGRALCLPLPVKARGIPAGTTLTIALGVRSGTRRSLATGRIALISA